MILVISGSAFEWQFAVGAVVTLILDVTKAIGFPALTRIEFDLVMVAAILTHPGDHQRQGGDVRPATICVSIRRLPLAELIDLSISDAEPVLWEPR